jgi:hypothetical protein
MNNISNKLLESVLSETLSKHDPSFKEVVDSAFMRDINSLVINYKNDCGFVKGFVINIYELAFKAKEWAWNNGYPILSMNSYATIKAGVTQKEFFKNNEIEVIFESIEWILKQRKDKK